MVQERVSNVGSILCQCHYKVKPTYFLESGVNGLRYDIVKAQLLGEASSPRTTIEKSIENEEGSLILRGLETPYRIQCHELQQNEEPTTNMAI